MSAIEIRCQNKGCNALFGIVDAGILTIKNRDMERHVEYGVVWGPCRKCETTIVWRADDSTRPRQTDNKD
jgi:hypothetical protein